MHLACTSENIRPHVVQSYKDERIFAINVARYGALKEIRWVAFMPISRDEREPVWRGTEATRRQWNSLSCAALVLLLVLLRGLIASDPASYALHLQCLARSFHHFRQDCCFSNAKLQKAA